MAAEEKRQFSTDGWFGVDLDGTLAHYDGWKGEEHIGEPVELMLNRVKSWIADGIEVRIVTARVSDARTAMKSRRIIQDWLEKHGLPRLDVTNRKDYGMLALFDDRAYRVQVNTGRII